MIRQGIRRHPILFLFLVVLGLLGSYALLRGASGTSAAAVNTMTGTGPTPAPVSAGISQFPRPEESAPQPPVSKSAEQKSPNIFKQPADQLIPTRASISKTDSYISAPILRPNRIGPEGVSFPSEAADPISVKRASSSKLSAAAPLPQGGSGSPPNPPTLNSPADGSTGASTSPTLTVNVSDPNSNNVTVNFYGKIVPSVAPGPSFSIVELPDTQYYSASLNSGLPAMFNSQTQWIVNNRVADNIAFVIGLGDIVQDGNNNGNYSEWNNANTAVSALDDPVATGLPQGIPYSFGVGNHDQGSSGDGAPDDTAAYNQFFGVSRYSGKSYYGGHYGTDNDNHYELFSAGGMDFIVINIAYMDPQYNGTELNSVLAWANGLLQTYSNRRGIVVSHYLINNGFNASWSGQGQATYNALSGNPNLFLMLCGHFTPPEGQRADVSNGNRVYTFLSDYQESGFGGDGWLRILTFLPASDQIHVQTYSPYTIQSETTSSGNFTVNYDMHGSGNNFTLLASKTGVLSGTATSYTWPSLSPGSKYEWYVTVSNSTGTAVGPLWSFTTAGGSPVTLSPSSLSFPSQPVNTTSASQAVTLSNTGSAALSITSIAASAQYAQTNNCPISPSTLPVNGICTINVTFTPTAAGTQSGSITITDSAAGSPQQISLTGAGTTVAAPDVSLSATSLTFGSPPVAVVQAASTTGTGSTTLAKAFASSVTKNNLLVVGVSSYAGNAFASPAITDTLGSTWSLVVVRNPGTAGTPSLAGMYYAVAPSTGPDTVTVHMTGTNNLHLHIYEVSGLLTSSVLDQFGSNFQSSATAATVSTSAATAAANEFVFAYFGRDNGSGTWTAGAGYGNTQSSPNVGAATDAFSEAKIVSTTVTQTATATSSRTDSLTSVIATFVAAAGGTTVGTTSAPQTVTLNNSGSASLSISSIVASGDYGQTNTCGGFVAVGASCTISVTFTPTATGTRTGTITITDNATGSPQTVSLTGTGTAAAGPVVSLSSNSVSFGNQASGTTSGPQTVTLSNIGSTALSITSIAASTQYAQSNTCGTSVAAGANCTISVTFTPTATGSQPGTITVTDSASGSPQIVTLSGTGVAPGTSFAPTSLSFGNQNLNTPSAAQSVTLTNTGSAVLNITSIVPSWDYAQANTCGTSVAAGGNCTISVTFTPTVAGSDPGTITVTDSASSSPQTVTLSGTGVAPGISFAPTSLSFGNQNVNTPSAAQTVTLTNSGTAALSISSIADSTQYAQSNTCGTSVAAGANCTISVTFTPTATGSQSGTITVTDSASGSPQTVALSGTGVAAGISFAPTSLSFGNQNVNTPSAAQSVTLTNTGTAALSITSIAASTQYAQSNTCGTSVAAGGNCTISITFTPTTTGLRSGAITVSDNASNSPQTVTLSGTGTAPSVSLSSTSLTFGNHLVNTTSAAKTVTLKNTGTASLSITSIVSSGDYAQTNNCGNSVAAGASCTISITFTPTVAGLRTGAITVSDNAGNSPQTVTLSGTGTIPIVSLSTTSLTFAAQSVGTTSAAQTVTLANTGTAALKIISIATSGAFSRTTTCKSSLAAGSSCQISVKFTPTATGTLTGAVTITDNAADSPQTINLTGTGM